MLAYSYSSSVMQSKHNLFQLVPLKLISMMSQYGRNLKPDVFLPLRKSFKLSTTICRCQKTNSFMIVGSTSLDCYVEILMTAQRSGKRIEVMLISGLMRTVV